MKLSILICTLPSRDKFLERILGLIGNHNDVQILLDPDEKSTVGEKRNRLLRASSGEYVAFCDDDDRVSHDYIKLLIKGIDSGSDCCSLKGWYYVDGRYDGIFEHSIKYKAYRTVTGSDVKYERYPNHLNCIRASIAKQFLFPEKNHGEDTEWATKVFKSGLIKTEHYIPEVIYYYEYRTKK